MNMLFYFLLFGYDLSDIITKKNNIDVKRERRLFQIHISAISSLRKTTLMLNKNVGYFR